MREDAELAVLEAADLVAQAGGLLELEVGRRLAHPLLELADIGLEVEPGPAGYITLSRIMPRA